MKVWIGYQCSYDYCDVHRYVERVFDDEVKALLWAEDPEFAKDRDPNLDWREYEERVVE